MAWVRVEASVRTNVKFLQAGPAASWLWLCGNAYCQETLTDGFIPFEALRYLGVDNPKPLIPRLVKARLWEETEGGWKIHDYLQHNKSAEEVNHIKAERRLSGAKGGEASGEARRKQVASTVAEANPKTDAKQSANPSTSTASATETATATTEPSRRAPLVDRHHRNHAHCGRVCLPASLFSEFVRRRNHDGADMEIRDWALAVDREWSEKPDEPGDAFDFWKARYSEKWPTTKAAQIDKWEQSLPEWARKVRERKAAQS